MRWAQSCRRILRDTVNSASWPLLHAILILRIAPMWRANDLLEPNPNRVAPACGGAKYRQSQALSDNKPFKIAAAEAATGSARLQSTVLSLIGNPWPPARRTHPLCSKPRPREEWDKVAPHLVATGRLKPLDRSSLAVYCAAYAMWLEASQTARSWQAFTGRQESAACSAALLYSGAPSGRRHCHR